MATPQGRRAREGLPSSHRHHPNVPSPLRRGVLQGCDPGSTPLPWPSPRYPGLGTPLSPPERVLITTRQASLDATDRWLASPKGLSTLGKTQPATGPPGSYPDGTHTRRRRQACVRSRTTSRPPTTGWTVQPRYDRKGHQRYRRAPQQPEPALAAEPTDLQRLLAVLSGYPAPANSKRKVARTSDIEGNPCGSARGFSPSPAPFLPRWTNANDLQTDTFAREDSVVGGCVGEARPAGLRTYRPALSYPSRLLAGQVIYPLRTARSPFQSASDGQPGADRPSISRVFDRP